MSERISDPGLRRGTEAAERAERLVEALRQLAKAKETMPEAFVCPGLRIPGPYENEYGNTIRPENEPIFVVCAKRDGVTYEWTPDGWVPHDEAHGWRTFS